MCLYWGNGSPAKVFAATPLLIMIMRFVLSFGRVNKQHPTNERTLGTHQAQADVDWMAMTSCGGSLNYLCHHTAEKNLCLLVCLIVFWDNVTVGWLFAGLSSSRCVKLDPEKAGVDLHNLWWERSTGVLSWIPQSPEIIPTHPALCLLLKSSRIMNLLVFSFVSLSLT